MKSRAKKKKNKKIISTKVVFTILTFVLIAGSSALYGSIQKNREINQEINELKYEVDTIRKNTIEMRELIEYFNSNAFIEEKARMDLGLKTPGEQVVIIPELKNLKSARGDVLADSELDDNPEKQISNFHKWWAYLFK